MKAIMISIRPQHSKNILNGIKTLEIRKKFPKDYVGWVYIYVTKGKEKLITFDKYLGSEIVCGYDCTSNKKHIKYGANDIFNGKVVARFWCDKVELIEHSYSHFYFSEEESKKMLYEGLIERLGCISADELHLYLKGKNGKAIHITKLEIFDKPKELSEFSIKVFPHRKDNLMTRYLTRAPQSWCYVEI